VVIGILKNAAFPTAPVQMLLRRPTPRTLLAVCVLLASAASAHAARIGLVVGEPFGKFGTMMPQGHANLYLADYCADTPLHLRPCAPGEPGVVLSRYHDLRDPALDWMAVPLRTFFYGTEDTTAVPAFLTAKQESDTRERYRREHLREVVPGRTDRHGRVHPPPYGDWEEGIGAAFDRRLVLYTFEVPQAVEAAIAGRLNDTPNKRRYTLTRNNCADFAAEMLAMALPAHTFHRNFWADFNMTTPKNLARQLDSYGRAHPEVQLEVFSIPQVAGTLRRSRPLMGAAEMFVAEKRYTLAVAVLQPELLPALYAVYREKGDWPFGYDATPLTPDELARFVKPNVDRLPLPPVPAPLPTESVSAQSSTN
jgi:hypothetical protein